MLKWRIVVGIDPSESSAGWCVLGHVVGDEEWGVLGSGQCRGEHIVPAVRECIPFANFAVLGLAVEGMFPGISRDRQMRPPHYWRLGFRSGQIAGQLMDGEGFTACQLWTPEPNLWRDNIGIRRGKRDVIAQRMLQWAASITGDAMEGPRGGKQVDRAMAVGIAFAMAKRVSR